MKLLYLPFIALLALLPAEPIDKVGDLIGKGNIHELSAFFAPSIDISILDEANTYPKAQAQAVLDKFFAQNHPVSCKMLHKVTSGTSFQFGVVIVNTDKGTYRAAFTIKKDGDGFQLVELRIENEKVK